MGTPYHWETPERVTQSIRAHGRHITGLALARCQARPKLGQQRRLQPGGAILLEKLALHTSARWVQVHTARRGVGVFLAGLRKQGREISG